MATKNIVPNDNGEGGIGVTAKRWSTAFINTVTGNVTGNLTGQVLTAAQTNINSILAADLIIGEDAQTAIDFGTVNEIDFKVDNANRLTLTSSVLAPATTNQIDLGTSSLEFKDAFFDGTVTADAFAGPLTGNVTGNASGTAATVTGAAQSNITSLGTLTGLNIGNDAAANLVFTPSSNDTITLASAANGAFTITTVDTAADDANVGFVVDGTVDITTASSDMTTFATTNSTSGFVEFAYNTSTTAGYIGNGTSLLSGAANTDFIMRSQAGAIKFTTGGANLALTIDASQNATFASNVIIGSQAFPAFNSNRDVLLLGQRGNLHAIDSSGNIYLNNNIYVDSSGNDKSVVAGGAAQIRLSDNEILMYTSNVASAANETITLTPRLAIESDGVIVSSSGIEFEGSALSTSQSGISSSGNGGSIRIFTNGNQAFTFGADGSGGNLTIADGDLVIGTAGHGITFSATNSPAQNAGSGSSNTLDNYEEGTWTPVITFVSGSQTFHSGSVLGQYTLVGRKVTLFCEFAVSDLDGASNNTLRIDGMPFNVTSSTGSCGYGTIPITGKTVNFSRTSDTRFSGNLADGGFAGIAHGSDASQSRTVVCLIYHI